MGGFRGFWGSPGTPPPFEKCISGRFPGARRPGFFGVTRATKRRRPERAKAGFAGQKGPLQAPLMCTIGRTGAEFAGPCWVRGAKGPFATPFMCTISRTAAELAGPCWVRSAFGFCGPAPFMCTIHAQSPKSPAPVGCAAQSGFAAKPRLCAQFPPKAPNRRPLLGAQRIRVLPSQPRLCAQFPPKGPNRRPLLGAQRIRVLRPSPVYVHNSRPENAAEARNGGGTLLCNCTGVSPHPPEHAPAVGTHRGPSFSQRKVGFSLDQGPCRAKRA